MTRLLFLLLLVTAAAHAQVYRWVDAKGTVHYSSSPPPAGVSATKLDIDTQPGLPAPDGKECYSVRCQGERMEERIRRRDEADARAAAERAANAPKPVRGGFEVRTWTYLPTSADPFTTTITLVGGRVGEVERVRKF